jgi:hypothetical protein
LAEIDWNKGEERSSNEGEITGCGAGSEQAGPKGSSNHMKISQLTRRDVFDSLRGVNLYGRLEETEFLSRIFDLENLPSFDSRFKNAAGDIWQHRINNNDWEDDWVFADSRFNLLNGDDEILLRFLSEMLHPVARATPDLGDIRLMVERIGRRRGAQRVGADLESQCRRVEAD